MKPRQRHPSSLLLIVSVAVVLSGRIWAQAAPGPGQGTQGPGDNLCGVPQLAASTQPNFFNDQQQVMLGDIMAEITNDRMESIDDPELTDYLQRIGERVVRHLPPSHLNYRFYLSDLPIANALSMSGGRVYVTRKLVARARTEDEVAGVIGHELGHIITHQQATDWTLFMSKALGVTSVSDRQDIEDKIDRVYQLGSLWKLSNVRTKPESEQQEADRVGMEAVVRAGYRPEALAEFFDRVFENKGKKGSWFSELFQTTAATPKRYREMLKLLPKLPVNCTEVRPADSAAEFQGWQKKVAAYRGTGRRESVHDVLLKRELQPPLQDEFRTLKFSPDGKLLLAQDSGTVWVLRRDPLQVLFQFAAPNAYPAMFSADSSEVLVYDRNLRIERWDVQSQDRTDVYEVSTAGACYQFVVAPDGNTLACMDQKMTLTLIDTETSERFFERKDFQQWRLTQNLNWRSLTFRLATSMMGFSPDGQYFLAASDSSKPVFYDVKTRSEAPLPGPLGHMLDRGFTFLGNDRIVTVGGQVGEKSRVARFPSGDLIKEVNVGLAQVAAAAHGNYLLLRPVEGYAVGVLDIEQNKLVRANKKRALDVYDDTFVSELGNGEIGLFRESATPVTTIKLPRGRLGRLEAHSISPDLHWLALSAAGRGGVWDLTTGEELYNLKGFQGSYFAPEGALYVDFPQQDKTPRNIVRFGLETRGATLAESLGEDEEVTEHGPFLTSVRPIDAKAPLEQAKLRSEVFAKARGDYQEARRLDVLHRVAQRVILEVKDTRTGKLLWSRRFDHVKPRIDYDAGAMVLSWRWDDDGVKEALKDLPDKNRFKGEAGDYLLEVLDAGTGSVRGRLLVAAAKKLFSVEEAFAAGDRVFVTDTRGRVLVYSLSDGSLKGHVYGVLRSVSASGDRFCVQPKRGELVLYDGATLKKLDEFDFSRPVSTAAFRGKGLFVLTSDQTAYELGMK